MMLQFSSHNPDVLECIANLSNDEIFTPPQIVNAMLDQLTDAWAQDNDGENIWENPAVKFLDPFTKSGIFLREITRRLVDGLEFKIPDVQERINHILTNQVYGIAITRLTGMLARRSVYCSKWANRKYSICTAFDNEQGNIWFERTEHVWRGGKPEYRVDPVSGDEIKVYVNRRCQYCGANEAEYNRGVDLESHAYTFIHTNNVQDLLKEIFGVTMQFDVVIGNPPYQFSDGGHGSSAIPIYPDFVKQAQALEPKYLSMVIPSRWFTGGKGVSEFRKTMLADRQLRAIVDYPDSREVFSGVDVAGGVCYFLWTKGSSGFCKVTTRVGAKEWSSLRLLDEHKSFIRDNRVLPIIEKVQNHHERSFSELVSPRRPFNIDSADNGDTLGDLYLFTARGDSKILSSRIGEKGLQTLNTWRVLISKSSSEHAGQTDKLGRKKVLSRMELMPPGSVCTESYLVVGPFESKKQAKSALTFLKTRFARFLIQTILLTQNITRDSFVMVPSVEFEHPWEDSMLYERYSLTDEEIEFIESTIRSIDGD